MRTKTTVRRRDLSIVATFIGALLASGPSWATPAQLLHTAGYQAPVHGSPDDLLFIAGMGLRDTDRVVYELTNEAGASSAPPKALPDQSTAELGLAPVVQSGGIPFSLVVHLPAVLRVGEPYRLWVVNSQQEWSNSIVINDARPGWITPSYVYSSADLAEIGRHVRLVGRNLAPAKGSSSLLRLSGAQTYTLASAKGATSVEDYVADVALPTRMAPGTYAVSFSVDGHSWTPLPTQKLEVRSDPLPQKEFALGDPAFGQCKPNDAQDDGACLVRAVAAASAAGGGVVTIPAGTWDIDMAQLPAASQHDGVLVPAGVQIQGAGATASAFVRHRSGSVADPGALLTLTGHNSIRGLTFTDSEPYASIEESRPVIQLGIPWRRASPADFRSGAAVDDIVITRNIFRHVGRAIQTGGKSVTHLFVTYNEIGAYDNGLLLIGDSSDVAHLFRIEDAVIRWNRFIPGSYTDLALKQGVIASQLGASGRVDFSSNVADGTSTDGLQDADDPRGWRAGFFWSMNGMHERLLVSENQITCPGDKIGDGEAIAFDGNDNTVPFDATTVAAATGSSVSVRTALFKSQRERAIDPATYYRGHWIQIVQGQGLGQARKVVDYSERGGTVTLRVSPDWDIPPASGSSRVIVSHEYWQTYIVGNTVDSRNPPCRKSNLTVPHGGRIIIWAPSADSVIARNRQFDSDGISFNQHYTATTPSCPVHCPNAGSFQTALEVTGNVIDGEYDWLSDCSTSGILGSIAASPTPESPPGVLSFGVAIDHNTITRADGYKGGAIDFVPTWYRGPPPTDWPLIESVMIFHNELRDIAGELPRANCPGYTQRERVGIRLDGPRNIRDAVLYANRCHDVARNLIDTGEQTVRVCSPPIAESCECDR